MKITKHLDVKYKYPGLGSSTLLKGSVFSAGYDFCATRIDLSRLRTDGQIIYGTDVSLELPEGYVGLVFPRSSIRNKRLKLTNSVGVIDSDYRGEITFTFDFTGAMAIQGMDARPLHDNEAYHVGDKIGQLVVIQHHYLNLIKVEELSQTDRGTGGYGSTGK